MIEFLDSQLAGVIFGGLIGFASGLGMFLVQQWFQCKRLAAALGAELELILKALQTEDPIRKAQRNASSFGALGDTVHHIAISEENCRVFHGNVGKIGLLPTDVSKRLIRFYSETKRLKMESDSLNRNYDLSRSEEATQVDLKRENIISEAEELLAKLQKIGRLRYLLFA